MKEDLVAFKRSPLIDAVLEIRFSHKAPEMVPGLVYAALSKDFPDKMIELPILQLPQQIRESNPDLKFQPTHKLMSPKYYLNVGPNVVGFGYSKVDNTIYPGWTKFFQDFNKILRKLKDADVLKNIERIGVRYINLLESDNLIDELNVDFRTGWEGRGLSQEQAIAFLVKDGVINTKVQINTAATINMGGETVNGQVIDLDASIEKNMTYVKLPELIEKSHNNIKEIFKSLLGDELKVRLGAKYE